MAREIVQGKTAVVPLPTPDSSGQTVTVAEWLVQQALTKKDACLLAFDLDGVIWGKLKDGQLLTASASPNLQLRWATLQEARLFHADWEVHLWRTGDGFAAKSVQDGVGEAMEWMDEPQMLWGNQVERPTGLPDGFTIMSDGEQGLRYAVPLPVPKPSGELENEKIKGQYKERPLRLHVRHYVEGTFARVSFSRLVKLENIHESA